VTFTVTFRLERVSRQGGELLAVADSDVNSDGGYNIRKSPTDPDGDRRR
jgi:hypothetical protein